MSTLTRPERLALLTSAVAATAALAVALALFATRPAAPQGPAPGCIGYVPAQASGQPILVPVDLCTPPDNATRV